jgi:hypothetical protein
MGADAIRSGSGRAFLAPYGTAIPDSTDDMVGLDVAFVDLGEVSEDGLEHVFSVDKEVISNWEGDPVKVISTKISATFKLTFLETTQAVLEAFYGADVQSTVDGSKIAIGEAADTDYVMVVSVQDKGTEKLKVYALERVQVMDRDSVSEKPGSAGYGMTFQAMKNPATGLTGVVLFDEDLTSA